MERPGGALASRPLHFLFLLDRSGSMSASGKIQSLNTAIREALPGMRQAARDNPNAQVLVRALAFADDAHWLVPDPTPVGDFRWTDIDARGHTAMGRALAMVAEQLQVPPLTNRELPPVIVMATDGRPTDDFEAGLAALMAQPWGAKAVRIAIAIGRDADYDVLERFIGNSKIRPLLASQPDDLLKYMRWASTVLIKSVSSPRGRTEGPAPTVGFDIPAPPPRKYAENDATVW
jgi:uncharacterized protein YegL